MKSILKKFTGGDLRSIGKSNEVVEAVLANPRMFAAVFSGLLEEDPLVRMRAADAIEKITKTQPELLKPFKRILLGPVAGIEQQEVQWHVAQMIPRLPLSGRDMVRVRKILHGYMRASLSNIVRVMSLQALAELALQGKLDRGEILRTITQYTKQIGTPSVRARARKLVTQLQSKR